MDENQMNNGMSTDNQDVSEGKHELQEGENHEVSTSKIDVIDLDCLSGADLTKLLERAQKEQEKGRKVSGRLWQKLRNCARNMK